jgi:eukaryotic-like serine/threonine-protein kinase
MAQESSTYAENGSRAGDWKSTDRYEILSCIGRGGMGVVYEAFDRERRQLVALKTLRHVDAPALYLFKQEFRTLAGVHHTNLVHLHELEVTDAGDVFFTMELLRGSDFRQYCSRPEARNKPSFKPSPFVHDRETLRPARPDPKRAPVATPLPPSPADLDRLRPALRQLVEGIHALHCAGKVHRDIKPSNVLVTNEGRVVVVDFGVATEVSRRGGAAVGPGGSGEVVGTARYMAPEQADETAPSPASDWYSVGVMLYEVLVGRPPFTGSLIEVLTLKSSIDPRRPSECSDGVPPDLDALCLSLLSRDPEKRPVGVEILRQLGVRTSSAPPPVSSRATDATSAVIGREKQLAELHGAFAVARSGRSIAVRLSGAAGMGKSTVVSCFLDELARDGDVLVLRGRAYEREAVPYKAVDSLVDALSRHLMRLDEMGTPLSLPADVWALARLFPVLRQVPGVGPAPEQSPDDPQAVRRRAFAALRAVFASLTTLQPLVLVVDDAQWGDVDSAALFLEQIRGPGAPPFLFLLTSRSDAVEESPFLVEMRHGWPAGTEIRDVEVGALAVEDAQRLALALIGADDDFSQRTARAVARASGGSPFLIEELVRSNRGVVSATGATLAVLTLDQMVSQRLEKLPEAARRLLEIVAVGGRPMDVAVVSQASGVHEVNETIALLGARRFARTGMREGRDVVESSNGRIAETIVGLLPESVLRDHHARLARALEDAGADAAEAIAMHWLGAGDNDRAARFASNAAEEASGKLAFDRAARLFRLTLEHLPSSSPEMRHLRTRLAETLRFAGNHDESAREYLAAAEGAAPNERLELQRAAADQMLSAGRIEEGTRVLHGVMAAVGMHAPRTPLAAVFWLIVYKIWLGFLGLRFKERETSEVSPEDRVRVEALFTVVHGFAIVDVILSACMQARHLIAALRTGDRFQVSRAVSIEASHTAATGKPVTRREEALVELAARLAERHATAESHAVFDLSWGVGLFQRGRWREARTVLERGLANVPYGYPGAASGRLFAAYTYTFVGELKESTRRTYQLCAEAENRGDLYTTVNLRSSGLIRMLLAADDPEGARRACREAIALWPKTKFLVQNWQGMVYEPDVDLYLGDPAAAYARFARDLPALKKSLLLHSGFIRAMTAYVQGRLAIASIDADPALRESRIAEARRMVQKLRREFDPWAQVLAELVSAMIDNASSNREASIASLRAAIERAEATDTIVFVPAARYRLGQVLGGEEGRKLIEKAADELTELGVQKTAPWLRMHLPGTWGTSTPDENRPLLEAGGGS